MISEHQGAKLPTLVLFVLTPLIAELSFGSLPIQVAYALLILGPIYGCGALLIRELVRRTGRGWPSILLLGVAYEVVEDGFGLQTLFSPHIYHAAQWGGRVFGINLAYADLNLIYHAVFTAAVPILITDLIFPATRQRPYLRVRGLVITACCYLLGVALIRFAIAPNAPAADPTYTTPTGYLLGAAIIVIALGAIALGMLPRVTQPIAGPGFAATPPTPWLVAAVAGVGAVVTLRLPAPLSANSDPHPMFGSGLPVLAQIAGSLAIAAAALLLLKRWSARPGWTDRHLVGLSGGLLLAHTALGASIFGPGNAPELVTLAILAAAELTFIAWLYRKVGSRQNARHTPLKTTV